MMNENVVQICKENGAYSAALIACADIPFDRELHKYCAMNRCGHYDKNYACPPDIGEPDTLIEKVKKYPRALVFQGVYELEDSYDFEGMMSSKDTFSSIAEKIYTQVLASEPNAVYLTAGACALCPVCAKKTNEACRFPEQAVSSLEAHCIQCSELAKVCGMKYVNGKNTVTYFGAVLLSS